MNNTPDDPIEKLLREQDNYIADDGFTRRVMTNLPRRRFTWLPRVVLLGAAVIGIIMAWQWLPGFQNPEINFGKILSSPESLFACLPLIAVLAALYHAITRGVESPE